MRQKGFFINPMLSDYGPMGIGHLRDRERPGIQQMRKLRHEATETRKHNDF
jgi:hypothetical protein